MTQVSVVDRLRLARLVAGVGLAWARRGFGRAARPLAMLRAFTPDRLLIAPQDIRTADPTIADDIYAGYFSFAGKVLNTHGQTPFEIEPPSRAWAEELAGFGWLRHLRAAETPLARANARVLVADWMAVADRSGHQAGWRPAVAARRLLSLLSQSRMILEESDRAFYRRFMKCLGRHAASLQNSLLQGARGEERLTVLTALAMLGLCAEGMAGLQRKSTRRLALELGRQILPDGGHIARNPRAIVALVLDLLPLRQAYAARGLAAPPQLLNAIDRMLPMLRMFRLGDGSLALFNGMGATAQHQLSNALAHDGSGAAATLDAPYSGYQRLEAGEAILVMDAGAPPPPAYSSQAHAGCLSFEFSSRGRRMVGNCGAPLDSRPELREAARATAAHSTLVVADTSSCHVATGAGLGGVLAGWIIAGPRRVEAAREADALWVGVSASHDGYAAQFGLVHHRVVRLSRDGSLLQGEDRLEPVEGGIPPDHPYAIRFHLHPGLHTATGPNGGSVVIGLSNGESWLFQAGGLTPEIEPSVNFANFDRARAAEQIVLRATSGTMPIAEWSFERLN